MRNSIRVIILFPVLSGAVFAAELTESERLKIQYLKHQIAASQCEFERNGKRYSSDEALAHIEKKQNYYKAKIDSVEKFIEFAASRSTVSDNPYYLHCPGEEKVTSSQWLIKRLQERK
jgi:hypothetical protein